MTSSLHTFITTQPAINPMQNSAKKICAVSNPNLPNKQTKPPAYPFILYLNVKERVARTVCGEEAVSTNSTLTCQTKNRPLSNFLSRHPKPDLHKISRLALPVEK